MKKPTKTPKAKATAKFKDLKASKNPTGGVFAASNKTGLKGGSHPLGKPTDSNYPCFSSAC